MSENYKYTSSNQLWPTLVYQPDTMKHAVVSHPRYDFCPNPSTTLICKYTNNHWFNLWHSCIKLMLHAFLSKTSNLNYAPFFSLFPQEIWIFVYIRISKKGHNSGTRWLDLTGIVVIMAAKLFYFSLSTNEPLFIYIYRKLP